jgi:hypothetical protein
MARSTPYPLRIETKLLILIFSRAVKRTLNIVAIVMKKLVLIFLPWVIICSAFAQRVSVQYDYTLPQANYAAEVLKFSVLKRGYILNDGESDYHIILQVNPSQVWVKRPIHFRLKVKKSPSLVATRRVLFMEHFR